MYFWENHILCFWWIWRQKKFISQHCLHQFGWNLAVRRPKYICTNPAKFIKIFWTECAIPLVSLMATTFQKHSLLQIFDRILEVLINFLRAAVKINNKDLKSTQENYGNHWSEFGGFSWQWGESKDEIPCRTSKWFFQNFSKVFWKFARSFIKIYQKFLTFVCGASQSFLKIFGRFFFFKFFWNFLSVFLKILLGTFRYLCFMKNFLDFL